MSTATPSYQPSELAAAARSVLAYPAGASLVVQGFEDAIDDGLHLYDDNGTPVFSTAPGSALERAAESGSNALLRVYSGLDDSTIMLVGRLRPHGCTQSAHHRQVSLELAVVSMVHADASTGPARHHHIAPDEFVHPDLRLNAGYIRRWLRHLNAAHQDDLRLAISSATQTRRHAIAGVELRALSRTGVEATWVDVEGAHRRRIKFARVATDPDDLAELLREHLHANLC